MALKELRKNGENGSELRNEAKMIFLSSNLFKRRSWFIMIFTNCFIYTSLHCRNLLKYKLKFNNH